jgi:serine protease Do
MRQAPWRNVLMSFVVVALAAPGHAQYSRKTPIVEAVQKTRRAVVTVRAEKPSAFGRPRESAGTGVIVDERGYIVTNCHIVDDAQRITVRLFDGTEITGRVLAADGDTDLAFLKINSRNELQALAIGPAQDLMVGETVIAVGHPFGYSNSVSTGIVSALGRHVTMPSGQVLHDLIQTDTSINPGNSGGPLLNINGELIGINVALREGAQGIAFAVNADTLKEVLSRRLSSEHVAGVQHGMACIERISAEGPTRQRVVIGALGANAPAQLAGLRPGDEVRRVGDREVANRFDVERSLWDKLPGERVNLEATRNGAVISLSLQLAPTSRGDQAGLAKQRPATAGASSATAASADQNR